MPLKIEMIGRRRPITEDLFRNALTSEALGAGTRLGETIKVIQTIKTRNFIDFNSCYNV